MKFTDAQQQTIVASYIGGTSISTLATIHECGRETIKNILLARGIELRRRNSANWMKCWH